MSNNLNIIETNFSDDQVDQSNFIAFSNNINTNTADTTDDSSLTIDPNTEKSKVDYSDDISAASNDAGNKDVSPEKTSSEVSDSKVKESTISDNLTGNIDESKTIANMSSGDASESSDKPSESMETSVNHEAVATELLDNIIELGNLAGPQAEVDGSNLTKNITEDFKESTKTDSNSELIENIDSEELDGTPENNVVIKTHKQVEKTCDNSSAKIEEIKVTETDQPSEKNMEHVENHKKEKMGEHQGNVQDDDEGDGILYIDEGNNNPDDTKPKDEQGQDSDNEDKDKDSSDGDNSEEEEEEDEDEKEFGGNIKEKKRSVMKKAKDESRPAEKIDIEAFKNEWSDEEGDDNANVDIKDTSSKTKQQNTETVKDGKGKSKDAVTSNMPDQETCSKSEDPVTNILPKQETSDVDGNKDDKTKVENDIATNEKKTRKLERTIYDSNGEVIAKETDGQPIETTDTVDTPGNSASNTNNDVTTSDISGKTESLDENMDESMLIEEISGDGEVLTEEMEVSKQEEGDVVMSEGQEEAIVVIGGANGENLEDFVIVNENNEEQEIFEEIAEDGTKTYYLKVKPTAMEQARDADNNEEQSRVEEKEENVETETTNET
ncbi:hypothetical protein WDU94_003359, partial [Cyamophila willieti]